MTPTSYKQTAFWRVPQATPLYASFQLQDDDDFDMDDDDLEDDDMDDDELDEDFGEDDDFGEDEDEDEDDE